MIIKTKRLTETAILPERKTVGSAGADLHANISDTIAILPNQTVKIPTGIAVEIPSENYVGLVFGRSGLGINNGIAPANKVGVVDSDYRGEIVVGLHNSSTEIFRVNPNDSIAQFVIVPVLPVTYIEDDDLSETERGNKGFGSTGKK